MAALYTFFHLMLLAVSIAPLNTLSRAQPPPSNREDKHLDGDDIGGSGGWSYSWGWGGGGGGGGGGGSGKGHGNSKGGGGGGGSGRDGRGWGWGWGGGGRGGSRGSWKWGCGGKHHPYHLNGGFDGEFYKLGEFAECMVEGQCQGMRLDCPLHCGGPCFYDCHHMCKAHCQS